MVDNNQDDARIDETGFSTYFYKNYLPQQFTNKVSTNPHFYITYGPPASGKATIMNRVLEMEGKSEKTVVEVNIDNIVKNYRSYNNKRNQLKRAYGESKSILKIKNQELYRSCRDKLADEASDTLLDKALLRRHDIVWETTGGNIAWTVKEAMRIRKLGYEIVLVYPYVQQSNLITRANSRPDQESAPDDEIKTVAKLAQKHLPKLINYVDRVYIYNNNGKFGEEKILLAISHEYLGSTRIKQEHINPRKKIKKLPDSDDTGHVYVVECSVDCKNRTVVLARDNGEEKDLVELIDKFCCHS